MHLKVKFSLQVFPLYELILFRYPGGARKYPRRPVEDIIISIHKNLFNNSVYSISDISPMILWTNIQVQNISIVLRKCKLKRTKNYQDFIISFNTLWNSQTLSENGILNEINFRIRYLSQIEDRLSKVGLTVRVIRQRFLIYLDTQLTPVFSKNFSVGFSQK